MLIDRVFFPVTALGPGNRLVIWTVGCSKHCYNCANPELWQFDKTRDIDINEFNKAIHDAVSGKTVDGITVTGGDPLEQCDELLSLILKLKDISSDVLVYTGYDYNTFREHANNSIIARLEAEISVLIDGPYIDALNDNSCCLRGSTNQRLLYFDDSVAEKYQLYLQQGRQVQNVFYDDKVISIGIHNKENER